MTDPSIPKGVNNTWIGQANTSAIERASIEDQVGSGLSWWYNYFSSQRARFANGTSAQTGFLTAMTNANLDGTWASIADAEYCPMILSPAHNNPTEVGWIESENPGGRILLGPTEPDQPAGAYPGYPVADVVTLWQTVYEPWRATTPGRRLGAPAVSQAHPANVAGDWLDLFMQQVALLGLHVDFIPLHFFFGYTGAGLNSGTTVSAGIPVLRKYLRDVWNLYQKPLWPEIAFISSTSPAIQATAIDASIYTFRELSHEMGVNIVERWNFWPLINCTNPPAGVNESGLYAVDGTINAAGISMKAVQY